MVAMAQVYLQFLLFQFGTRAFTPSAFGPSAHDLPCSYAQCLCYKTTEKAEVGRVREEKRRRKKIREEKGRRKKIKVIEKV